MRTHVYTLIATFVIALAGPTAGQEAMKAMSMPSRTAPASAKIGTGTGVVKAIDAKAGTVTLQHGPIPAIGWPAMTMTFKASPPSVINGLKVGQTVDFDARVRDAAAEVTAARPK